MIKLAYLLIALAITLPAQAGYGFALAISPEIRLQPGSHVHLPARLTNTGTLDIVFGPRGGAFDGQFNDLTLRPGEHIDFAYLNIHADADAPLGAISHQYPLPGNPAKAKLAWVPKISIDALVAEMVREDLISAEWDELINKLGCKTSDYHE